MPDDDLIFGIEALVARPDRTAMSWVDRVITAIWAATLLYYAVKVATIIVRRWWDY